MHELSIAYSLVEAAAEAATRAGAQRVVAVQVVVGALSGVATGALTFCWEIATAETSLAGSRLDLVEQPVVVYCPDCRQEGELAGVQLFRCPQCGRPTGDVRRGRELQIESLEIETAVCDDAGGAASAEEAP
ncbi:MAG TPA: hydrogenase maturation nickel metallochaperone HypA [Acidobacteria bacterium]|nr:hydrogenase maturation nickel metallochaperone HypA [Acidobacteriota bacterium]